MPKFLILFILLFGFGNESKANVISKGRAELLNPKAYSVLLEASLFSMVDHFDTTGVEIPIVKGTTYKMIDTDFKVSYGVSSNIETSLMAKFRNVKSSDGVTSVSNTGPESLGLEAKYAFVPIDNLRYAIGIRYRQTLYTNTHYSISQTPATDKIILGDDGSEYGVDFYTTYLANPWRVDFKIGYNSPPNELSSEIIYDLSLLYKFTKLSLVAGIEGIRSLKRDQFTDTPNLKPLMSTGQSYLFNSLNREKNVPYLGMDYEFSKLLLGLKGKTVMSGKSTDKGNTILASLTWNSEGVTAESVKIDSFKEYHIDGSVLKVSPRGNLIKIDQGLSTDVEKGAKFDIYQTDYFGGNVLVASGFVLEVGADWAVIKLTKKYKEIEIKPGFAARGY